MLARRCSALFVWLAVSLAVVGFSGVARAGDPAEEQQPEHDPGTVPPAGTNTNLIIAGAAFSVGWYGVAFGTSYLWTKSPGASDLRVPIAGPFMALAKTGCADRETSCTPFTVVLRTILTTLSAVGQVGGVAVMAEGLFLPSGPRDGQRSAGRARGDRAGFDSVAVVPLATEDGNIGLLLSGEF
jgi:hypothetical protein